MKCPHCDNGKVILLTSVRPCEKCGGTGVSSDLEPIKLTSDSKTTLAISDGNVVQKRFVVDGLDIEKFKTTVNAGPFNELSLPDRVLIEPDGLPTRFGSLVEFNVARYASGVIKEGMRPVCRRVPGNPDAISISVILANGNAYLNAYTLKSSDLFRDAVVLASQIAHELIELRSKLQTSVA